MPQRINKRLGKNAIVSTLLKNLTPIQPFGEALPNDYRIRRGTFIIQGLITRESGQKALVVKHSDYPGSTFQILPGNTRLDRPGPPNQFFSQPQSTQNQDQQNLPSDLLEGPDDDTEPIADGYVPEPIPQPVHGWEWADFKDELTTDWRGLAAKSDPYMNIGNLQVKDMGPGQFFDCFFPWNYIRAEVIPATNAVLREKKQKDTTIGEIKLFFGLWTVISLNPGYQVRDFFIPPGTPKYKRDFLWNPPYLGDSMSRARFDVLHSSTRLRKDCPPTNYRDKFWHIRILIDAFNKQMAKSFAPSWLTCLDESMVTFFNAFCPGWMNVKRKPHPFGNEYHTIACCDTHIIFFIELVEGKDKPSEGPNSEVEYLDQLGATPALVTRMTRSIWGTGRVVLLDSVFGYLRCLQVLKRKGFFGTCVIKK